MLYVLIYIFYLLQIFYGIKLIDWSLIYTNFLFLGKISSSYIQDFIEGLIYNPSIIYCSEADSSFSNYINSEDSFLEEKGGKSGLINSSPPKSLPAITINHNIPGLQSIGEGITVLGKALINYTPLAAIGAAGISTSTILKALPPTQRVGITLATTGIMVGGMILNQGINNHYLDSIKRSNFINNSSLEESSPSLKNENLKEIEEALISSIIDSEFIYSSLERVNSENSILLAIIIFATSGLYALISLTISLLIKEFSPENHPFVTARPRLLKYFKFLANSNKIYMAILIFLVGITFVLILISATYLRTYSFKGIL